MQELMTCDDGRSVQCLGEQGGRGLVQTHMMNYMTHSSSPDSMWAYNWPKIYKTAIFTE